MSSAAGWPVAVTWLTSAALYLLFAGEASPGECGIAAVLATLATMSSRRPGSGSDQLFSPVMDHLARSVRALAELVPATVRVGKVLARIAWRGGSPGRARRVPFARGPERDPKAASRRATALLARSFAPDSFVVRAERGRDEVVIHAILPDAGTPDRSWLS